MWSNWSRGQSCAPAEHVRPASRAELSEAVARGPRGARGGRRPLVLRRRADRRDAARRSSGSTACSTSTAASGLVRAEAGIRLHRLVRELHAHGLALPNLGDIDAQSLAGALATGTHGTGAQLGNLASSVEAMELVLADGSELTVDGGDELRAARVGLGALGVVAAVTLRCVPAFRLHAVDRPLPLDEVLGELDRARRRQRPLRALHVPALAARADAHQQPQRRAAPTPRRPRREWLQDVAARQPRVRAAQPRRPARVPRAIPRINRLAGRGRLEARARGRVLRRLRQPAARALRGDGVRAAARARRRGGARRARDPRALPGLVPDRAALLGRRRRPALARARARDGVRRRPRVRGHGVRGAVPRGRGRDGASGAAARTGASARSSAPRELAPRYPRWDDFAAIRERLDPDGRFVNAWVRQTLL